MFPMKPNGLKPFETHDALIFESRQVVEHFNTLLGTWPCISHTTSITGNKDIKMTVIELFGHDITI